MQSLVLATLAFTLVACSSATEPSGALSEKERPLATPSAPAGQMHVTTAATGRRPWSQVHNFVYWLSYPDLRAIGQRPFELAVIDYSGDGTEGAEFSSQQIAGLKEESCSRRVLAYLSIGEAEDYRWYWSPGWRIGSPAWIVRENPRWQGNYLVRYWDPDWQRIVFRYLDRIIAQGFDGVYLDIVNAYQENYAEDREADMVEFVSAIAGYARSRSALGEDFGVFIQNAEELAANPSLLAVVTGIGREETYFFDTDQPIGEQNLREAESYLDRFRAAGKLVLTVDYATKATNVENAYLRSRAKGYVPYVTSVELDRLTISPGYEPQCRPF